MFSVLFISELVIWCLTQFLRLAIVLTKSAPGSILFLKGINSYKIPLRIRKLLFILIVEPEN